MTVLREYAAAVTQPTLAEVGAPYDEVAGPDGTLRHHWRQLAADAVDMTFPELRRVHDEIARLLADDGVTYTTPGEDSAAWQLDPLPLVLPAEEWAVLEKGPAQRP